MEPHALQNLLQQLSQEAEKMMLKGHTPVVVCAPVVRINLRRVAERQIPSLIVLSYNELVSDVQVEAVGMVRSSHAG